MIIHTCRDAVGTHVHKARRCLDMFDDREALCIHSDPHTPTHTYIYRYISSMKLHLNVHAILCILHKIEKPVHAFFVVCFDIHLDMAVETSCHHRILIIHVYCVSMVCVLCQKKQTSLEIFASFFVVFDDVRL